MVDYNASSLGKRVAIARPKRRMRDTTPEDEKCVLIEKWGARSERMGSVFQC